LPVSSDFVVGIVQLMHHTYTVSDFSQQSFVLAHLTLCL